MSFFRKLFGLGDSEAAGKLRAQREATTAQLDALLARHFAGEEVSRESLEAGAAAFSALYDANAACHGTTDNNHFPKDDAADYYVEAVKLAAIGHPSHTKWPVISTIRARVLGPLKKRIAKTGDAWTMACAIEPALGVGEPLYALELFDKLSANPNERAVAMMFAREALMAHPADNDLDAHHVFVASLPRATAPWNEPSPAVPPALRSVIYAATNSMVVRDPGTTIAMQGCKAAIAIAYDKDWGVVDATSARRVLEHLLVDGHRAKFARRFALEKDGQQSALAARFARSRALAFDIACLVGVARASAALGYLEEAEVVRVLYRAHEALTQAYASWDEFADDFALGADLFFASDAFNHAIVTSVLTWLRADPASPWKTFPLVGA